MVTQTTIDNLVSQNLSAEFPLVLSEEELRIVKNYKTSTLILGRSGTGKTTCLVYTSW
jgi:ABC-type lipoprotein export system ATPase subunit